MDIKFVFLRVTMSNGLVRDCPFNNEADLAMTAALVRKICPECRVEKILELKDGNQFNSELLLSWNVQHARETIEAMRASD